VNSLSSLILFARVIASINFKSQGGPACLSKHPGSLSWATGKTKMRIILAGITAMLLVAPANAATTSPASQPIPQPVAIAPATPTVVLEAPTTIVSQPVV
jgi:hypothetical protein